MNTYYIPVHFYERETAKDELIMITTKRDIDKNDLIKRLGKIKARYTSHNDECSSKEEMCIAIFDNLADEVSGIWCYCKTLPQLVIGGSDVRDEYSGKLNLKPVCIEELTKLLTRLNPGENLYFYTSPEIKPEESGYCFCAAMIKKCGSYAIYINCLYGGLPFVMDLTTYYQDLKLLISAMSEYFNGINGKYDCFYFDSDIMGENFTDE